MRFAKTSARVSRFHGVSSVAPRPCVRRRGRSSLAVFTVAGVGNYIAEAFARIFSVADDDKDVPWESMATPFTGRITHHEESQLRRLYDVVQAVKGCTDASATNFDPAANLDDGSCVYDPDAEKTELKGYLKGAVERVFGNQFKGDETEPAEWPVNPFSGEIKSQREIEKMLWFEKVVSKTLDDADVEPKDE